MNPVSGAPSLPAAAGPVAATDSSFQSFPWPGLAVASADIGVPLDATARERFGRYRDLLLEWNTRYNLTAIREPIAVEQKLFLDSLAMVPALERITSALDERTPRVIDIGSGAGFPGLALKIARPEIDVTLVDSTAKKVAFLDAVIADLDLAGTRAVHSRAETLGQDPAFREQFDVATARAVAALPVLLEYVVPLLIAGGFALLPKGLDIDDELLQGAPAAKRLGAEISSSAPISAGTRLVIAHKRGATPTAYPRRIGVPLQTPLGGRC